MSNLVVAALFLVGTHFGIASSQIRTALVHRLGETAYLALYSLLSLVAIGWLVVAWRAAPFVPLWNAGLALRYLPLVVMPIALLLVVCGLSGPNPTALGQRPDPDAASPRPASCACPATRSCGASPSGRWPTCWSTATRRAPSSSAPSRSWRSPARC